MDFPAKIAPKCPFQKLFPSQLKRDDKFYMSMAYNQALEAWKKNEVPIGAVIEAGGEIVGSAHNQVETTTDPTAHAEMLAITQAASALSDWRLNEATLYVTKEPCPMCSGATIMSRLKRVVFAVPDPKMGGLGGAYNVNAYPGMNHTTLIEQGLMEDECKELIQTFFRLKRQEKDGPIEN
ncbi:MAG: tRNA adenosine(34) deaminase TadA [Verrucomicrobiota bacterium]